MIDLLNAQLTGDGVPRAVNTRTTLSVWRRAVARAGGDLSTEEGVEVARLLGAGQLLLGDLVATPGGTTVLARVLKVPESTVIAEHSESGTGDELRLVNRLLRGLLARSLGEDVGRLGSLSDSLPAVKAYLTGLAAFRRGENLTAEEHLRTAVAIDPQFAIAALWRTLLDYGSASEIEERAQEAWKLRHLLTERDRALLMAHFGIGPNYPRTSTMAELLSASERAAQLNPDRPEVWYDFGSYMYVHGPQVRTEWRSRAALALDSAIALDASFVLPARWRFEVALSGGDRSEIERYAGLHAVGNSSGDFTVRERWLAAHALGDQRSLTSLGDSLRRASDRVLFLLDEESALHGFPLQDVEDVLRERINSALLSRPALDEHRTSLWQIAVLRGRVAEATQNVQRVPPRLRKTLTTAVALVDPAFENVAGTLVEGPSSDADSGDRNALCYDELWRVAQGDTSGARLTISLIETNTAPLEPAGYPRVGRFGVCTLLLSAFVERIRGPQGLTPARDSLEALVRAGPGLELPVNIATLLLARWLSEDGYHSRALEIVRRRLLIHNPNFTIVLPAHLREEGRLAALSGDPEAAVRAYRHYLALRDQAEAGPARNEVHEIRRALSELTSSRRRR